jgi:hypothetical protein
MSSRRGNRDVAIAPLGISDFPIDEVKVNLLLDPSQKMCPGNYLLKVHVRIEDLRLKPCLLTHHGNFSIPDFCCHAYSPNV